jgi:Arm DNA-binding domain
MTVAPTRGANRTSKDVQRRPTPASGVFVGVSGKTHIQTYPQIPMSLTDTAIKAAKPGEKPYKLIDERGLCLHVHPTGGRRWRLKYRVAGREKLLAIGVCPDVSLAKARERREEARQLLVNQVDPNARKKAERLAQSSTFLSWSRASGWNYSALG